MLITTPKPDPFIELVIRLAPLPYCDGLEQVENGEWYGDSMFSFLICRSCFEEVVHSTIFASSMSLRKIPGKHHCSLYSDRMRERYFEACQQKSLDSILDFAAQREEVYHPELYAFPARYNQRLETIESQHRNRARKAPFFGILVSRSHSRAYTSLLAFSDALTPCSFGRRSNADSMALQPVDPIYDSQLQRLHNDMDRQKWEDLWDRWKEVE